MFTKLFNWIKKKIDGLSQPNQRDAKIADLYRKFDELATRHRRDMGETVQMWMYHAEYQQITQRINRLEDRAFTAERRIEALLEDLNALREKYAALLLSIPSGEDEQTEGVYEDLDIQIEDILPPPLPTVGEGGVDKAAKEYVGIPLHKNITLSGENANINSTTNQNGDNDNYPTMDRQFPF